MRSNDINLFLLNIAAITVVMAFDGGARRPATNGKGFATLRQVWHLLARVVDPQSRLLLFSHGHHVCVEIGNDQDRAADNEQDDPHPECKRHDIVRAFGPEADMQEKDEMDANLRQSEDDQPNWNPWAPKQIRLRNSERSEGQNQSE